MNTITIEIKTVYGNDLIYPVCASAHRFAQLAGKKTLSRADLSLIRQLDFTVVVQQPEFSI